MHDRKQEEKDEELRLERERIANEQKEQAQQEKLRKQEEEIRRKKEETERFYANQKAMEHVEITLVAQKKKGNQRGRADEEGEALGGRSQEDQENSAADEGDFLAKTGNLDHLDNGSLDESFHSEMEGSNASDEQLKKKKKKDKKKDKADRKERKRLKKEKKLKERKSSKADDTGDGTKGEVGQKRTRTLRKNADGAVEKEDGAELEPIASKRQKTISDGEEPAAKE